MSLTIEQILADLTELTTARDLSFISFHQKATYGRFLNPNPDTIQSLVLVDDNRCAYGHIEVTKAPTGYGAMTNAAWLAAGKTKVELPHKTLELFAANTTRSDYREACALFLNVVDYLNHNQLNSATWSTDITDTVLMHCLYVTVGDITVNMQLELSTKTPHAFDFDLGYEYYFTPRYWPADMFGNGSSLVCKVDGNWVPVLTYRITPDVTIVNSKLKIGLDQLIPSLVPDDSTLSAEATFALLEEMRHHFIGMEYIGVAVTPTSPGQPSGLTVMAQDPYRKTRYEIRINATELFQQSMGAMTMMQPMMPRHQF